MVKGWVKVLPFYLFTLLPLFASCSEQDDTIVEEYPNWQQQNEEYFEQQYLNHTTGSATSFVLKKWTLRNEASPSHTECILVDVIESGDPSETATPYLSDIVAIHYSGRLLPSTTYTAGYIFDSSFYGSFDPSIAVAVEDPLDSYLLGFTTALLHMHRGDHWRVTIPYQLGYGTADYGDIPGYSTLIFDIWMEDFWTDEKGDRD